VVATDRGSLCWLPWKEWGANRQQPGRDWLYHSAMSYYGLAYPYWVNLLLLVPLAAWLSWRRRPLQLTRADLFYLALFGIGFGFVEAAVVVYLRAAAGMLPGYHGTLADVARLAGQTGAGVHLDSVAQFPASLMTVELFREAATILMLVAVAAVAARGRRERFAAFLWIFSWWDICYYAGLRVTVRWPQSLTELDVLFLIPEPWVSAVWFPVLISSLCVLVVAACTNKTGAEPGDLARAARSS